MSLRNGSKREIGIYVRIPTAGVHLRGWHYITLIIIRRIVILIILFIYVVHVIVGQTNKEIIGQNYI